MQVQIDVNLLVENGISADDFLALYAIYRKGFKTLDKLKLNPNWDDLQSKGYVKLGDSVEKHIIRQEFIDLFSSDFDQMFAELISTYPMKVSTNRGYRILHAADPNCKSNQKAKAKYSRIVGTKKFVHEKIMKLLKVQLRVERGKLEYMQQLEVWLNNHTWEKYINMDENAGQSENRITRRL
jgi:hypothetical protein|tara:strand:- start:43 stop:588 length:546 start_codon:yes stop_codon:yes gene_type:complete